MLVGNMNNIENIGKILSNNRNNAAFEKTLMDTLEIFKESFEISQDHNRSLENQLKEICCNEKFSTTRYIKLEEEICVIREQNETLRNEMDDKLKKAEDEKQRIQNEYEFKLKKVQEELKEVRKKLEDREKEFFEELQMAQATSSFEFDKIEQQLKWKLSETEKKLQESNDINSKLRTQLRNTENQKGSLTGQNNNSSCPNSSINTRTADCIPTTRQYEPLQLNRELNRVSSFDDTDDITIPKSPEKQKRAPQLYRGTKGRKQQVRRGGVQKESVLPPLMPCSSSSAVPPPPVKRTRRLHDPENFYNLNQFADEEV